MHFASLGVHSLKGHFLKLEKAIEEKVRASETESNAHEPAIPDAKDAEEVLEDDALFRSIVVQRSRGYVRESQKLEHGRTTQFPHRDDPRVADYDVRKVYGELLDMLERAFSKKAPLFRLAIYNPAAYGDAPKTQGSENRGQPAAAGHGLVTPTSSNASRVPPNPSRPPASDSS